MIYSYKLPRLEKPRFSSVFKFSRAAENPDVIVHQPRKTVIASSIHPRSYRAGFSASDYKLPKLKSKDPFDRMLAWQAICKGCILLTKDSDFADYRNHELKTVW